MKYVKVSAKVDRRIKMLMQSGKIGKTIAEKAMSTIDKIKSGKILDYKEPSGIFTKYGERRIRNCRKFDFASGYRLISLQRDSTVYITFLGTHDECQRWLENNSGLKRIATSKGDLFSVSDDEKSIESSTETHSGKYYEEEFLMNLSEQDLRTVFCGIVESVNRRRE